jgi:nitrogen fixation protein FixH
VRSYRWIPWAIAGALGVVVAVNGALAYFAVTSSTGLVTEHPFNAGNSYNCVLDAAAAEDALGWHGWLHVAAGEVVAELTDRDGQPLRGLAVSARLVRPVGPLADVRLDLSESAPGRYAAAAASERRGQWDMHVTARRGADRFELTQRIIVR